MILKKGKKNIKNSISETNKNGKTLQSKENKKTDGSCRDRFWRQTGKQWAK